MNFFERRKCKRNLRDLDFQFAGMCLVNEFKGVVIENQFADLLDTYLSNPCVETAIKLIDFKPQLMLFFLECKPGGIYFIQNKVRKQNEEIQKQEADKLADLIRRRT